METELSMSSLTSKVAMIMGAVVVSTDKIAALKSRFPRAEGCRIQRCRSGYAGLHRQS